MAMVMLLSLTMPTAWAAEGPESSAVTDGKYTGSTWAEGGNGTLSYSPDDDTTLNLSKTAAVVSDNVFDITLTVEAITKTQMSTDAAAVVLVIDVSGSMKYCADCGGETSGFWGDGPIDHDNDCPNEDLSDYNASRMKAAKDAALSFLSTYAGTNANAQRMVAVVSFQSSANTRLEWVNVAGGAGQNDYNDAVTAINNLSANGGTNLDDGLYHALAQLNSSTVSGITAKSVIALTDGAPTRSRTSGDGTSGSATINSHTAAQATNVKNTGSTLYTVCFGAADDVTYEGGFGQSEGPTVGNFLRDSVASSGCAYNADNTAQLMAAFKAITEDITAGIESKTVNDPMGDGVTVTTSASDLEAAGITGSNTLTWELQNTEGTKNANGTTTYVYTATYRVHLDADAEGFDEDAWHPANGVTTLNWGDGQTFAFPVPGLKGVTSVYTVIYDQGDYGTLEGDDGDGQIIHEGLKKHTATPDEPTVVADSTHYFTGWSPVVADTVTEDVTYVAQYAPKTEITVTANSDSVVYNGAAQSVSGYTYTGLPAGYVLSGLTATVSGTNVGTYTNKVTGIDTAKIVDANGKDVTEQFTVNTKDGLLTINKKDLTITADSASKVYDGQPLTKDTYTNTELAAGDAITSVTITGTQTAVGSSNNVPSAAVIKDGDKDVTANYNITYVNGKLTVTELEGVIVTIKENSGSYTYNGGEQSVTGYEIVKIESKDNLYTKDDFKFVGTDADKTVSGKDVGTYNMGLTPSDFQNTNPNFKNVTFIIENGTLVINKKDVTITSATDSKDYDGTALTNSTVTAEGFVAGEGATYNVTGSQTNVGTSDNTFTYTLNANTKASNYNITKVEGTLTVSPLDGVVVTIVGNTTTKTYNGSEQSVTGYTVSIDSKDNLYTEAYFTFSGDATAKGTNVGEYPMGLAVDQFANTNPNFSNVKFQVTDGKLTITPKAITVTADDKTKVYGTEDPTLTATVADLVDNAEIEYTLSRVKGEDVGDYTITVAGAAEQGNYTVTYVPGTLTITPVTDKVTVTITENSGSEKYDGTEKTVTGYVVTDISNDLYTEAAFTFSGDATIKGTDAGSYDMELKPADFANVSKNFTNVEFVIVDGTLEIAKRVVTLTSADDEQVYNGSALTNDTVTVTGDGFVTGEGATYDVTGTQTDVGSSNNTFTYTLNEGTKAANYDITTVEGTLTVTPVTDKVTVTITENSGTEKYDGTEKTVTGYTVSIDNALYTEDDFTFGGDATVKGTDVATYNMELKAADFTNISKNFSNVEFVIVDGTLVITKRAVTLTSATAAKTYDGTALQAETVTVSGDGFVDGEGASYSEFASITDVGSVNNSFTYTLNEGTKAANYDITVVEGTLTISKKGAIVVTITENSDTYTYNGAEQFVNGYTVKISDPLYKVSDFTFSGNDTVKGTDAGTYEMELKPENFTNTNTNFDDVTFQIVDGTMVINPKAVTIASPDDEKVYDGTALTNDAITAEGFVAGEGATYDVTGSQLNVGSSANAFTYTLNEGTKAENYTITKTEGTLVVTPVTEKVTVTITENSGTEKYDGTEKTVTGYTVAIDNELYTEADFEFSGNATVKGTDAGTYEMLLKPADFTNVSENFSNVEFVIVDGTLEITKRVVTLTSADDEKVYDGTALTNSTVSVSGDGFAQGEGATYDVTGTQTDVGSSDNAFTYALNEGTKAANYEITTVAGTLTVTPFTDKVTVTITEHGAVYTYDSTEKTVTGYDVAIDNELYTEADFEFKGTDSISATDAGAYDMELTAEDFTNVSKNFTNVEFVIVDGQLVINKLAITVTADSNKKVYDGTALTDDGYTNTALAEGDAIDSVSISGSQTDVGISDNVINAVVIKDGDKVVTNNYDITTVIGKLEVTPLKTVVVTITENSGSEIYNGAEQVVEGYVVTDINTDLYTVEDFTFEGDDTAKGTNVGTYDMKLTAENFTNINDNFEDVTFEIVDGQLEITKMALTITAASGEKIYDGTPLTDAGYKNTALALDDEIISVSVVGSQTEVGSSANVASNAVIMSGDEDVTANYDITYVDGELKVTKKGDVVVTITENSGEYVYDGTEKVVTGYTVAINTTLYTEEDFTFSGDATVKGTDAGLYPMELVKENFANTNPNFDNVTFVIVDGTLGIKVRPITVTINGNTDTKVYNGAEQSVEGYTVEIADELYTEEDIAFSGEDVAKGTTVGTYDMGLEVADYANTNENFQVTFVVNDGKLTITPLTGVEVTITENSGEYVYDGTEKTVKGYTVATSTELYTEEDFAFSGDATVKGTYVGAYDMELKAADFANTNENFEGVIFKIVDGQLTITPIQTEIVITADSNEKVYDGTALTDDGYTYDQSLLVEGDYIVAVVEGSQTNVGSSANKVTSYQILRGANAAREIVNVTDCYANVTTVDGTLTVTKRPVVLTSGSDSKVYDGTALTKEEVTVSGDGWAEGEGAAYSEFASITNVGSVNNSFTYTLNEGTDAANYDITVVEGVLTVNKYTDAKLEATGYTGVYDGQMHDGVTDKAVVNGIEGDEWTYTYSIDGENFVEEMPQYQDVGTYTVYVKATNPNYEGDALTTTVPVVITPATIVVTADDHVIATGDPDPELTYQVSTPVETETPAFDGILVRQEGAAKGEYPIEQGTLVLVDGEGFKASNYVLEYVPGTLTILQRAIDVEKTVDVDKAFVGDTITYTFVVTNTGEVDLQNVILIDEMLEIAGEIGALAIGETWTGELTYVATKEDIGQTLYNTVIVLAEGDTYDEDTSEGTTVYEPVPDTGDHTPVAALSAAMLVSLAGVIVLLRKQRKESAE